jgi:hypothetical protein
MNSPQPKPRRKPRSDSVAEIIRIAQTANLELAPPSTVPLRANDWPFWHSIVAEYARADWTPHQLELAALFARTMADLELVQRQLGEEGLTIERPNGQTVVNPRMAVFQMLSGQLFAYRRTLGLTARAKAGSSEDAAARRIANRRTERALRDEDDNGLLA